MFWLYAFLFCNVFYVVYKSYRFFAAVNGDTPYNIVGIFPVFNIKQRISVNDREIFHFKPFCGINSCNYPIMSFFKSMCFSERTTFIKIFEYHRYI